MAARSVEDAGVMARNADLERQLQATGECDAADWPDSPQGKRFDQVGAALEQATKAMEVLSRAAGYNPKKPPRA